MLLSGAHRIMEIQAVWPGDCLPPVSIDAQARARERPGTAVGLFFSGDVDSLYTLLQNVSRYARTDSRAISHVLLIHGYDIRIAQEALFEAQRSRAAVVADGLDRRFVPVVTNVGDVFRELLGRLDFGDHHCAGPLLASVAAWPDWAAAVVTRMEHWDTDGIGGRILPRWEPSSTLARGQPAAPAILLCHHGLR
jgi:hypothetical protein